MTIQTVTNNSLQVGLIFTNVRIFLLPYPIVINIFMIDDIFLQKNTCLHDDKLQ
jgi:hypothetical protein